MEINILKITRNNKEIVLYVKNELFNGLAETVMDSVLDVEIFNQPERSKREDLCFCEYCEEDKQKREIAGFICKQCMQD